MERRLCVGREPVRIVVVQEGPERREGGEELLYSFMLSPSEDHPLGEAPERGDRWAT